MKKLCAVLILSGFLPFLAQAEEGQEIHVDAKSNAHLIGAELVYKHTNDLYTVKNWGLNWIISIDYMQGFEYPTKTKFESAYGTKIEPKEISEKDILEIKGKLSLGKDKVYHIQANWIKDLSLKTGEPPIVNTLTQVPPPPPPPPVEIAKPSAAKRVESVLTPQPNQPKIGKLTMLLKPGYRGGQVKILQEFLKKQGYMPQTEEATGYFGNITSKALAQFQKANALEAVGILGPKTRALINSLLAQ